MPLLIICNFILEKFQNFKFIILFYKYDKSAERGTLYERFPYIFLREFSSDLMNFLKGKY